jgi:hypothetical protein
MENAAASAGRHCLRHEEGTVTPEYAVGDKVLLLDVTLEKGESIKLKRRYTGPCVLTECRPGSSYKLQHAETGTDLKRAVRADRLRPLKEIPNDYRWKQQTGTTQVAAAKTELIIRQVAVGEPNNTEAKAFVYWADADMSFLTDPTNTLHEKLSKTCLDCAREQKSGDLTWQRDSMLVVEVPGVTLAPEVWLFAITPKPAEDASETQQRLKQAFLLCLEQVERRGLKSVALAPLTGEEELLTDA